MSLEVVTTCIESILQSFFYRGIDTIKTFHAAEVVARISLYTFQLAYHNYRAYIIQNQ